VNFNPGTIGYDINDNNRDWHSNTQRIGCPLMFVHFSVSLGVHDSDVVLALLYCMV